MAQPRSASTVTVQPEVTVPVMVVGTGIGGVVRVEPGGQVAGMKGQGYLGHSGLSGRTQYRGQAWNAYDVVVVYFSQMVGGARGA